MKVDEGIYHVAVMNAYARRYPVDFPPEVCDELATIAVAETKKGYRENLSVEDTAHNVYREIRKFMKGT